MHSQARLLQGYTAGYGVDVAAAVSRDAAAADWTCSPAACTTMLACIQGLQLRCPGAW